MTIVDDLLANAGLFIGIGHGVPPEGPGWVGRLVITPLPGSSGVALDYEATSPQNRLQHREHSVLGRMGDGPPILVVSYNHDNKVIVLSELGSGLFAKTQDEPHQPGQLGIRIEVLEHGRVRHAYCRADADGSFSEFDVADLRLVQ